MTATETKEEKPSYYGHRARLRERFMVDEGNSMPDYEILELLLMMAIPRRDVKEDAKKLLKKFGDIKTILHMPAHKLLDAAELPPIAIVLLRLVHTCMLRAAYSGLTISEQPTIMSLEYLKEMCWDELAYKEVEEFWVLFFDDSLHFMGKKHLSTGTVNKAIIHPREVIRAAVDNNASKMVIVHNHPSGSINPSDFDKAATREIETLVEMMDVELFDHYIVAKEGIFSFRDKGLIKPKEVSEDATGRYDKKIKEKQKNKKIAK